MTEKEKILRIAINLENDNAEKFKEIQENLGIRNKTDVLRWLINWYYKQVKQ